MSITSKLKQISVPTLELLRQNPMLIGSFFDAHLLPESNSWREKEYLDADTAENIKQRASTRFGKVENKPNQWIDNYDWKALEKQFISEWETPELDLHKYFPELTYLLAGYIPAYYTSGWIIPELEKLFIHKVENNSFSIELIPSQIKTMFSNNKYKDFLPFLAIENSEWDNLPLVNAIGAGKEIGYETGYGPLKYLLPNEVGEILDGLIFLDEEGFKERFIRESQKVEPLPWIDWSEDEMLDWLTDYFNDIEVYYEDAVRRNQGMLLYLI